MKQNGLRPSDIVPVCGITLIVGLFTIHMGNMAIQLKSKAPLPRASVVSSEPIKYTQFSGAE